MTTTADPTSGAGEAGRSDADEAGVADRVRFRVADAFWRFYRLGG